MPQELLLLALRSDAFGFERGGQNVKGGGGGAAPWYIALARTLYRDTQFIARKYIPHIFAFDSFQCLT